MHAECPGNWPPLISDTRSVHAECPGNGPPLISDTRSVHAECPGNWPPLIILAVLLRVTFVQQITRDWTCFNHTVRRWYPVANISLQRQVQLYETHARGGKGCLCNT
jgi:hypothetical protein